MMGTVTSYLTTNIKRRDVVSEWFIRGFLFALGIGCAFLLIPVKNQTKNMHKEVVNILEKKNIILERIVNQLERIELTKGD